MSLEYRRDEAGISTTIIEEVSALDVIFHVLLKGQSNRQGITFIYPLCVFPEIKPMVLFAPYASRGTTVAVQLRHRHFFIRFTIPNSLGEEKGLLVFDNLTV